MQPRLTTARRHICACTISFGLGCCTIARCEPGMVSGHRLAGICDCESDTDPNATMHIKNDINMNTQPEVEWHGARLSSFRLRPKPYSPPSPYQPHPLLPSTAFTQYTQDWQCNRLGITVTAKALPLRGDVRYYEVESTPARATSCSYCRTYVRDEVAEHGRNLSPEVTMSFFTQNTGKNVRGEINARGAV